MFRILIARMHPVLGDVGKLASSQAIQQLNELKGKISQVAQQIKHPDQVQEEPAQIVSRDLALIGDQGINVASVKEMKALQSITKKTGEEGGIPTSDELKHLGTLVDKMVRALQGKPDVVVVDATQWAKDSSIGKFHGRSTGVQEIDTAYSHWDDVKTSFNYTNKETALQGILDKINNWESTKLGTDAKPKEVGDAKRAVAIAGLKEAVLEEMKTLTRVGDAEAGWKAIIDTGSEVEKAKALGKVAWIARQWGGMGATHPEEDQVVQAASTAANVELTKLAKARCETKFGELGLNVDGLTGADLVDNLRQKTLAIQAVKKDLSDFIRQTPRGPAREQMEHDMHGLDSALGREIDDIHTQLGLLHTQVQQQSLDKIVTSEMKQKGQHVKDLQAQIDKTDEPTAKKLLQEDLVKLKTELSTEIFESFKQFAKDPQILYVPSNPYASDANLLGGDRSGICGNFSRAFAACLQHAGIDDSKTTGMGIGQFMTRKLDADFIDQTASGCMKDAEGDFGAKRYVFKDHSVTEIPDVGFFCPTTGKFAPTMDELKQLLVGAVLKKDEQNPKIWVDASGGSDMRLTADGVTDRGGGAYRYEGTIPG